MAEVERDADGLLLWRPARAQVAVVLLQLPFGLVYTWYGIETAEPILIAVAGGFSGFSMATMFYLWRRRLPSVALFDDGTALRQGMPWQQSWAVRASDIHEVVLAYRDTTTLIVVGHEHPVDYAGSKEDLARIRAWHRRHHDEEAPAQQPKG